LVSLKTEVDMVLSYYFLLKKRHCEALTMEIDIPQQYMETEIPPLTLQMLVENTVNQNTLTKNEPINIVINVVNSQIQISHNVQPKLYGTKENEEAIDNIANKFRLLTQKEIQIMELPDKRVILLPLMEHKELSTT
jgi:two-component system, LytTR family, sensor kinase